MTTLSLICVLLWLTSFQMVDGCPPGCYCLNTRVVCDSINSRNFPSEIPPHTQDVVLTGMNIDEVPEYAFADLLELKIVTISDTIIGTIKACAFSHLALDRIELFRVNITMVQSYAFHGLTNMDAFTIGECNIGTIQPYAINDFEDVADINIYQSSFDTLEQFAFNDIQTYISFHLSSNSIKVFNNAFGTFDNSGVVYVVGNNFETWECNSLNNYVNNSAMIVRNNLVNCGLCGYAWLKSAKLNETDAVTTLSCYAPADKRETKFTDVTGNCTTEACTVPADPSPNPQCMNNATRGQTVPPTTMNTSPGSTPDISGALSFRATMGFLCCAFVIVKFG